MGNELCLNCFKVKGKYEVCPHCGYVEGTQPKQPHYLVPGTILAGHFIVGTVIGAGGFGIIYKCYDMTLGVIVAVKEFYPVGLVNRAAGQNLVGLLSGSKKVQYEKQRKRFLSEARTIAQFGKAKDIVNVYDYFEENNTAYIIMEYIDGILLKEYLEQQGKLPVRSALLIVQQIITAVRKIHAKGIIHRDISPDNIFIDSDNSVKIFDFGAARLGIGEDEGDLEQVVKQGYSAPEQYREKEKQGFGVDIYSVGAILYEMVTGVRPMNATDREYRDELKSPLQLGIRLDKNLDRTIMEALAVKQDLRFQGIGQLEDAIAGKRLAEYPQDKIRRRKRKRNGFIAASVVVLASICVAVGLFSTVLKQKNPVTEAEITDTTITVWVDDTDKKEFLEDFVTEAFHRSATANDTEQTQNLLAQNQKITVEIQSMDLQKKTMDEALEEAKGTQSFPDVFLTDNVSSLDQYDLLSMGDSVYQAISDDLDEYYYMSRYEEYFPEMKEMPTGLDVMLYYAFRRDEKTQSAFYGEQAGSTVEVSEILQANQDGTEQTNMSVPVSVKLAAFLEPSAVDYSTGTFGLDGDFGENLLSVAQMCLQTQNAGKAWKNRKSDTGTKLYGTGYFAGVGFRKEAYGMAEVGSDSSQISCDVKVPVVDGKMLVQFCDKYAISGQVASSEAKKNACVRFLWSLMGQDASGTNEDTYLPISKQGFETYMGFNTTQNIIKTMFKKDAPCVICGKGSGTLYRIAENYKAMKKQKSINSADEITAELIRQCQ